MTTAERISTPPKTAATVGTGLVPKWREPCTARASGGSSCFDVDEDGEGGSEEEAGSFVVLDAGASSVTGGGATRGVEPWTFGAG